MTGKTQVLLQRQTRIQEEFLSNHSIGTGVMDP